MAKPAALHKRACDLLGVDPAKVPLVGPSVWRYSTGQNVGRFLGRARHKPPLVYINRNAGYDTYIHEVLHVLFPSRTHSWIFGAAFKLARISHGRYAYGRWQSRDEIKESRAVLLRLARQTAKRKSLAPNGEKGTS